MERGERDIVQACTDLGVRYLTFFAFSAKNLQCPEDEVSGLLDLPAFYLQQEVINMNVNGVCFKVVSDTSGFDTRIQSLVRNKQLSTIHNDTLTSAANYGGRWGIVQAVIGLAGGSPWQDG